jgi:hypothetical protein
MGRNYSVTVRLTGEEREWLRRKAHWEETTSAELLRKHIHFLIKEDGYLRPPDDEPQDFGYEKEIMQFIEGLSNEA